MSSLVLGTYAYRILVRPGCYSAFSRKENKMRIIGLDLATRAVHKAIVANERNKFITPVIQLRSRPEDLERLRQRALKGAQPDEELVVIMEATDIVWYPVATYFLRHNATVHLVNPRMSADLARFYKRHAQSDKLAAEVLVRLHFVSPEKLYPLVLSDGDYLALQRGAKELDRLMTEISAMKNRLRATDRLGWPELTPGVFKQPFCAAARWFREHFYNPQQVLGAGAEGVRQAWQVSEAYSNDEEWIEPLVQLARDVQALYGDSDDYLNYSALAAEVRREQRRLAAREADAHDVRLHITRPIYRRLHPSRNLETIPGVGQDGSAVFVGFIGTPERFANNRAFRGWSGMIPRSRQSGESESKGLSISKAGPNLVKKFSYLDADAARKRDPQIAAIYYDQMVNKGKHHTQAVCACATHMLDRVRIILTEDRAYELRDVDNTAVTPQEALEIIAERYTVPKAVRERNNRRARRERAQKRAERKAERRSHAR